jgi:CubicO group peptidase (beta-lactamase class C family)
LSHSAGFPMMLTVASPTLQTIVKPLVQVGLAFQPGRDWRYGPGVEIQGYLVERWSGKDLSDFLTERLFGPLGMVDTGFYVDPSKATRVAKVHSTAMGRVFPTIGDVATSKPTRLSPSGGLYATASDYWKFCQMLLDKGSFGGKQYLKPDTVKLMHTNVLESDVHVGFDKARNPGTGFGVDFAVVLDSAVAKDAEPKGSYYWGGAFGTWFWIDPANNVTFVGMVQSTDSTATPYDAMWGPNSLKQISARAVYAALSGQ